MNRWIHIQYKRKIMLSWKVILQLSFSSTGIPKQFWLQSREPLLHWWWRILLEVPWCHQWLTTCPQTLLLCPWWFCQMLGCQSISSQASICLSIHNLNFLVKISKVFLSYLFIFTVCHRWIRRNSFKDVVCSKDWKQSFQFLCIFRFVEAGDY